MKLTKHTCYEPLFFFTMVLVSIIPLLLFKHFPTLDGPAHLYNSNILGYLITGDSFLEQYFALNSISTPNWLGHILILGFQRAFGSTIAEKLIVALCIAGLAYSFRFLVSTVNPQQKHISYTIFPFTYSFFLFLGFFNFIISLVLLFVCLAIFLKLLDSYKISLHIATIACLLLAYLAHPFGFFSFLLFSCIYYSVILYREISKKNFKQLLLSAGIVISIIIIPCLLYIDYTEKSIVAFSSERIELKELIRWIYRLRSLVVFNFGREQVYTTTIFISILALSVLIIFKKFKNITDHNSLTWLISSITLLILYFILPNQINSGGYVSDRLNYLFFIFVLIWISSHTINKMLVTTFCTISIICHFGLMNYYFKQISTLNKYAESIHTLARKVEPNSVILPLGTPPDWMLGHISNYIGANKKVVILENYEAYTGYFPIVWNWQSIPNVSIVNTTLMRFILNHFRRNLIKH